jgi:hypothetical protein
MSDDAETAEAQDALLEYDWGGDGSDLSKPVAAHTQAALVSTAEPYSASIARLRTVGDALQLPGAEERVAALGFTQDDVPELVRMTRDRALNTARGDSDDVWAPIHALTALKHLDVGDLAGELVPLFDVDSEWFNEELPELLGKAGQPALEPLRAYVQDRSRWHYGRWNATQAVAQVGKQHPELREQAVQILSDALEHAAEDDPETNGFLVTELVHLKAVEALPIIRRAFELDVVDESIMGDWSQVLKDLGQPIDGDDPLIRRSRARWDTKREEMRSMLPPALREPAADALVPKPKRENRAARQKSKRKQSAASRKANKKKRK